MTVTTGVQRIVCATDLTERSTHAMRRAGALARQTGARLTLLHVIDARQADRVARMQANRAYAELLSQVDRAFGSATGFIDVVVRRGGLRDVIARTANEADADLVVVAAPRSRRLDPIVGTTAERLVRTTKRPILVVHRELQGAYTQVAIATDLSSTALPMIRTAIRLGALDRVSATLIHAIHPSYAGMMRSAGLDEETIGQHLRSSRNAARVRLQAMIADAGLWPELTRVVVSEDSPATAVGAVLERERPELLAIGASRWILLKRLLIGSVADRLIRAASCDVLLIPQRRRVLTRGVLAAAASEGLTPLPVRRDVPAVPHLVPVQRRLQEHDRGDRRGHAHE